MTLVNIDITGVASSTGDDDRVVLRAPMIREKTGGGLVDTREETVHLTQGVGEVNLEPGPVMVKFLCEGVSDTGEKMGVVPEDGPVDVFDVLADSLLYPAPVVGAAQQARNEALEAVGEVRELAETAQGAAQSASSDATQTDIDRDMTERARARAEAAAWKAEMTTVGVNVVETPTGSGLWTIGAETLTINESTVSPGLYEIGVK